MEDDMAEDEWRSECCWCLVGQCVQQADIAAELTVYEVIEVRGGTSDTLNR